MVEWHLHTNGNTCFMFTDHLRKTGGMQGKIIWNAKSTPVNHKSRICTKLIIIIQF